MGLVAGSSSRYGSVDSIDSREPNNRSISVSLSMDNSTSPTAI